MTPSEVASQYIGQTEKPKNSGFNDVDFERKMRLVGFQTGHAWCQYFCELVYKEAFPERFDEFDILFSGSTIQTFRNFQNAAYPIGYVPQVNSMVIWQMMKEGKPQMTGHAGIVSHVIDTWQFKSIEGNTNSTGGREGFEVAEKDRKVLADVRNGLKVLGFIQLNGHIHLTI